MTMKIITRAQWGARPPRSVHRIALPTPRLWVHHSADDRQGTAAVRAHQAFHMDHRGWSDIAYSFLIDDHGNIYEGRGPGVAGGHTAGDNTKSHAICLLGNFEHRHPTPAALDALVELARHGRDQGWWVPTLGGHRDAPGASTACPGRHLYAVLPLIRERVNATRPPAPAAKPPAQEDDDMPAAYRLELDQGRVAWVLPDGTIVRYDHNGKRLTAGEADGAMQAVFVARRANARQVDVAAAMVRKARGG